MERSITALKTTYGASARILVAVFCLFVLASCAHKGGTELYPDMGVGKGYSAIGRMETFENDALKIGMRQAVKNEPSPQLVQELLKKKYVVMHLSIENKSEGKVIYNQSYTVLTDDALDYRKPLDYTDLYDIAENPGQLAEMKGKFYDLNVRLAPGEKTERLLIFPPLSKDATRVNLAVNEIYIGTGTISASFPFILKEELKPLD